MSSLHRLETLQQQTLGVARSPVRCTTTSKQVGQKRALAQALRAAPKVCLELPF